MPVTYTHSAVVVTPRGVRGPMRQRVPVRFNGRIWVDHLRRQYHPETGKRMSAPHTNGAFLQLDTLRERQTNGTCGHPGDRETILPSHHVQPRRAR